MRCKTIKTTGTAAIQLLCLCMVFFLFFIDFSWAVPKPLYGLCYGPFREGQSPETGVFPTLAQNQEDLEILQGTVRSIRTYGNDNILFQISQLCQSHQLDCYVGTWISDDAEWNQGVIDGLIQVADANYSTTQALLVGNEYLLWREFHYETTLINLITQLKTSVELSVSTAEPYHVWLAHPNLAAVVDFIGAHIHPYWEGVAIENAAQHAIDRYHLLKQSYPDKPVILLEVGWPSEGPAYGAAVASLENQRRFLKEFVYLAKKHDIKYFLFEAFDEPWKSKYGQVEAHWGLWDKHRILKAGLSNYLYSDPADINKDLIVDVADLRELAMDWLKHSNPTGPYRPGDINQDGITNLLDLRFLAEKWLAVD